MKDNARHQPLHKQHLFEQLWQRRQPIPCAMLRNVALDFSGRVAAKYRLRGYAGLYFPVLLFMKSPTLLLNGSSSHHFYSAQIEILLRYLNDVQKGERTMISQTRLLLVQPIRRSASTNRSVPSEMMAERVQKTHSIISDQFQQASTLFISDEVSRIKNRKQRKQQEIQEHPEPYSLRMMKVPATGNQQKQQFRMYHKSADEFNLSKDILVPIIEKANPTARGRNKHIFYSIQNGSRLRRMDSYRNGERKDGEPHRYKIADQTLLLNINKPANKDQDGLSVVIPVSDTVPATLSYRIPKRKELSHDIKEDVETSHMRRQTVVTPPERVATKPISIADIPSSELNNLADKLYETLERKLRMEKTRRGY